MIRGLNGKPYLGFDDQIDVISLDAQYLDICRDIAMCEQRYSSSILEEHDSHARFQDASTIWKFDRWEELVAHRNQVPKAQLEEIADVATPPWITDPKMREIHQSLPNWWTRRKFEEVAMGAFQNGEHIPIRANKVTDKDAFRSFKSSQCYDLNQPYFRQIRDWVDTLPFMDVGRIFIFITYNGLAGKLHYDRRDDWYTGEWHFLWFNPLGRKPLYIVDDESKGKMYVKSRSAFWNMADLHGSDSAPHLNFSIRVDGQFTKGFCDRNGIKWKLRE